MPPMIRTRFRRNSAAQWAAQNPVLWDGEPGWDSTNLQLRIGDGIRAWQDLPIFGAGGGGGGGGTTPGADGLSAYQLAVNNGYVGTLTQWLASLKGAKGDPGLSAFQVAQANGFSGTETQWLASLVGPAGSGGGGGAGTSTVALYPTVGATVTLSALPATVHDLKLTVASAAITLPSPGTGTTAVSIDLVVHQDATGGRAITFATAVTWLDGAAPIVDPAPNATTEVRLFSVDGRWYGFGTVNTGGSPTVTITTKTANYTLGLADAGEQVDFNSATAVTVTVPNNTAAAFPIGTTIEIGQPGAGQVTIAGATGVTLNSRNNAKRLAGQFAQAAVRKIGTNTWRVLGDVIV